MSKISEILEGWGNYVKEEFHVLEPTIKVMAEKRMNKCNTCPIRNGTACSSRLHGINVKTGEMRSGCGCFLAAKTLAPSSDCPLGKW